MTELSKEEKFIRHAPCENCGSRDNLAIYSGHTYCFGCQQYKKTNGELPDKIIPKKEIKGMITGITEALPKRRINSETAKLFNYETGINYFEVPFSNNPYYRWPIHTFIFSKI